MKILLVVLFFFASSLRAQTTVSGEQSGVWQKANSPYLVEGNITVNETLTIEAGVEVRFTGHYQFVVHGTLFAVGSAADTILFTSDNVSIGWGGLRFENAAGISRLEYCVVEYGKTSAADYPDNHGGAVALINSDAVFRHCVFRNNEANGDNDGMGGAVYAINTGNASQTRTVFSNCSFLNNYAYGEGGAIKFSADLNTLIDSCIFIGNNCKYGGGAIALYSVYKTKIKNSLFAENFTEFGSGGAIQAMGDGNLFYVVNSTFYGNEARHGDGGGIYMTFADAEIVNSIIWGNSGMYSDNIFLDVQATANINYSNLPMPDGATGENNINANPLFADAGNLNFHLTPHSPSVDAGTDFFMAGPDTLVNIENYYGAAPDMGAYEFYPAGAVEDETLSRFELMQNYPNPFNPVTTIKYTVPSVIASEPNLSGERSNLSDGQQDRQIATNLTSSNSRNDANVQLVVYDILGREVATLVNQRQSPGNYSVQFDASNLPSGTYFYTLRVGDFTATKKMVLLK